MEGESRASVGCEGASTTEGNELPLAARKERRLVEGEGQSGAVGSSQGMAEVREGEWLSRSLESCHELDGIKGRGGAIAGCRGLLESGGNRREGRDGLELSWASSKW